MNTNERMHAGFKYLVEVLNKQGDVVDQFEADNLMPTEGTDHMLSVVLKAGSASATWYLGLFEGNYTPTVAATAATLPGDATECTTYTGSARIAWTPGSVAAGVLDNSASKAEFVFATAKTVYGGFLASTSPKGSTAGVLLSVVRFPSPRVLDADSTLRVTAGITLTPI